MFKSYNVVPGPETVPAHAGLGIATIDVSVVGSEIKVLAASCNCHAIGIVAPIVKLPESLGCGGVAGFGGFSITAGCNGDWNPVKL